MSQPNKEPKAEYNNITENTKLKKKYGYNSDLMYIHDKSYLKLSKDYQKLFCPTHIEQPYK
jgi:hypothetical protein